MNQDSNWIRDCLKSSARSATQKFHPKPSQVFCHRVLLVPSKRPWESQSTLKKKINKTPLKKWWKVYFWWEGADWVQDTFFCALILHNTSAGLKSPSCILSGSALLILRNHLFAAGSKSHHTDSWQLPCKLQPSERDHEKQDSCNQCSAKWCLGTRPEGWKEEPRFMWFPQYSKRGFPCSRWAAHSLGCGIQVAPSPCFPILPTHPKPSSTLVSFPLNHHCILQ